MAGMVEVGIHQAKTQLSRLLKRAATGEDVVITRGGKPVARLVPIRSEAPRQLGLDQGLFDVPSDFNAPLPQEILSDFE